MNIEIAKQRYKEVFRSDVTNNTEEDFLAKHVPMKRLYFTDHSDISEQDKKHPLTEEELFNAVFMNSEDDQFVLVKGASGAGKTHLIRWFNSMLEARKDESEAIIYIKRADNTLKGTIRQLIEIPEVKNLPNKNMFKKLADASKTVSELEFKNEIYYGFITLIESDDGTAGDNNGERIISNSDRRHLVALLQNASFRDRLMVSDGPIDRIYNKTAENKTVEVNDKAAKFEDYDFEIDSSFNTELINSGADFKAKKIAEKMLGDSEFTQKITIYMNKFVERVIQRSTGLMPGDLSDVITEIRQELFKQNKRLTILLEDITAASGIDDSILDAMLTDKAGYPEKKLCRLNSVVGVADGYYRDNFRTNTKGRIKLFVNVPDEMFNGDFDGLLEFVARYLNTVSLEKSVIKQWINGGAIDALYPIHTITKGEGWGEYKLGSNKINIFPFTVNAVKFLYKHLDSNQRNPRALMRNIIEPYLKDALEEYTHFPVRRTPLEGMDTTLLNEIENRSDLTDEMKIRLSQFMYIWGNGTSNITTKAGVRYIASIPESVYHDLGLPIMDGTVVTESENGEENETIASVDINEVPETIVENEQVSIALKEIEKWILNKDYRINVGATTKNVRALNDARKHMNEYLFSVIDWVSEGVPLDAVVKLPGYPRSRLVAFERQTQESDAVIVLPATIESKKIIEAFVRWAEIGNQSWNFEGATDYLYRVLCWTEKIKSQIIESVMQYNNTQVDYFSYATAAEFYRLILNGYCKNFQSPLNFTTEMLLQQNVSISEENGHTKSWNDLKRIVDGQDGKDARSSVLQYYNLPQGRTVNSTNYEFDYLLFNKAVRKVINTGLVYSDSELQLDDTVKKRRVFSEYLKKILDRVGTVVTDEKKAIEDVLNKIKTLIDITDLEEDDIKSVINEIKRFYDQAQLSHVSIAVHKDTTLINNCLKNSSSIASLIKLAVQIIETEDNVESLIKMSRDPVGGLSSFVRLLTIASDDLIKAQQETNNRLKGYNDSIGSGVNNDYALEKNQLISCQDMLKEVNGDVS